MSRLLTARLFVYHSPIVTRNVDYSTSSWYVEGHIIYSVLDKVAAWKDGKFTEFSIKMYEFNNVNGPLGKHRLINYIKQNPQKYPGWLHHINWYIDENYIERTLL